MKKLWDSFSYAIILMILSILSVFIIIMQTGNTENKDFVKITINEGDTLWEIAENYSGEHRLSQRDFIKWVEENNGIIGSRIFPGEELVIPVPAHNKPGTELASGSNE